jgi:hypothetical protein
VLALIVHENRILRPPHIDFRCGVAAAVSLATAALLLVSPAAARAASTPAPTPSATSNPAPTQATKSHATFGLGPSSATGVDGRATFLWSVTPGGTLADHVAVVNNSAEPLKLDLYARDAINEPSGALSMQAPNAQPTEAGSWVTLEIPGHVSTVTVPARSTLIVPIGLNVPTTATPGDHTAGIITSLDATATAGDGKTTVNQNLDQRIAIPVEIRVAGPVHPQLSVVSVGASYRQTLDPVGQGGARVTYTVKNTGNVNLGAEQSVEVRGIFGSTEQVKPANVPILLPGSSVKVSVNLPGVLPEIRMTARVTLTPLVPTSDIDPGLVRAGATHPFWAIPWVLIAIIVGLAFIAWWARRRSRGSNGPESVQPGRGGRRRNGTGGTQDKSPTRPGQGGVHVHNSVARLARRLGFAATAVACLSAVPIGSAYASSGLPYTDQYAHGLIGLCDKNGNNVTHGSIYDKPFVWKAVSNVPAPPSFRGSGQNATLYAYQPRQGVDAGEWSGEQLTATSAYSDPAVPIAQSTDRDEALSDDLNDFPPQWNRLVELRMFLGSLSNGTNTASYPAADIRIDGTTWTLVQGATVSCKTGTAISMEAALPSSNPAGRAAPQPLSVVAAKAVGAPAPKSSPTPTANSRNASQTPASNSASSATTPAGPSGASSASVAANSGAAENAAASSGTGSGSSNAPFIVGLVVVVAGLGGIFWWRSRAK